MWNTLKTYASITVDSLQDISTFVQKPHELTLKSKQIEADGIMTFVFDSKKPVSWQPGQYGVWLLTERVKGKPGRFFTIASAPGDDMQFSTRIGASDFKQKLQKLEVGAKVRFIGPLGRFVIPDSPPKQIVLVAGGIGITPMRALLRHIHATALPIETTLVHSGDKFYLYKDELEKIAGTAHYTNRELFPGVLSDVAKKHGESVLYYISGPPKFVQVAEDILRGCNVQTIKKDGFLGY